MKLGEKIRYLREVEGSLRDLGRPMTQQELIRAVKKEQRKTISQSYISQIENGSRPHMTQSTTGSMLIRTRLWLSQTTTLSFFPKIIYKSLFKNMYRIENLELCD